MSVDMNSKPGPVLLEALDGGVLELTLNRPGRFNAFNLELHAALSDALNRARENAACRALLLTGAGKGFCAGQDLGERVVAPGSGPPDLGESLENRYNPLIRQLKAMPKPVICAVNGAAAGAGANLALPATSFLRQNPPNSCKPFPALARCPIVAAPGHCPG